MRRASHVLAAVLLAGCSETSLRDEGPNRPPETSITSGPPDASNGTSYRVNLAWFGSDSDGPIDHYEWILVEHPAAHDSITGDDVNRVAVTIPTGDDPRWRSTTAIETLFVVRADTLRRDPRPGPGESPEDVRRTFFERWHTFFVRAVDDRGVADPSPDYRSFNARTLAPTVSLLHPVRPGQVFESPRYARMHWIGEDPLDKVQTVPPDSSRWILVPVHLGPGGSFVGFPDSLYALPRSFQWSPWRSWNSADRSGVETALRGLFPTEFGSHGYLFAVQAKDAAGAVTPVFDWQTPGKNNVALITVENTEGPALVVHSSLGDFVFTGTDRFFLVDAAVGQNLQFRLEADASQYGSGPVEFRFGWDLQDLGNDEAWSSWSTGRFLPPRTFSTGGTHRLHIEARDDLGIVTRGELRITVHAVTRSHTLLFVDDTRHPEPMDEALEDQRWNAVLDSLRASGPVDFDPTRDVFDVETNRQPPPLALLFRYATVVWNVKESGRATSALRQVGRFWDPFVSRHQDMMAPASAPSLFLDNGGELWICGDRPSLALWPVFDQADLSRRFPVCIVNWDDPIEPHPEVDSVGVNSLLFRMGVECFDLGSSSILMPPRNNSLQHGCRGLLPHRAAIDAPLLSVDSPLWEVPVDPGLNPLGTRPNIEIYNMSLLFLGPHPLPRPGVAVGYTYVSGVPSGNGVEYPFTADRQAVLLLNKREAEDTHYSRALCGFEPWRLTPASHLALARWVLVHHMGVGGP